MNSGGDSGPPGSWEWAVCGASVTGSEHQRRGLGCDDAFAYGTVGDFVVAAVADGAGSVSGTSAWGSYAACQSVLANAMNSRFIRNFRSAPADSEALIRTLFEAAATHVTAQSEAFGLDAAKLSTTLCVALADRGRVVFGQIGDGIIAAEGERPLETLLIELKDEYANATWFIQSDKAFEESYRTATRSGVRSFALSTDGMAYKITNVATGEPYEPFFRGSWQHVRDGVSSANFTSLLRSIEDDQTGDDKTMVLASLGWVDDEYYPSARPTRKIMVSSAVPAGSLPSEHARKATDLNGRSAKSASVPASVEAPTAPPPAPPASIDSPPRIVRREKDATAEEPTDPLLLGPGAKRRRWGRRTT